MYAAAIENLIEKFEQLPGIGRRSAERIAFHVLESMSKSEAEEMAAAIVGTKEKISLCHIARILLIRIHVKYALLRSVTRALYV